MSSSLLVVAVIIIIRTGWRSLGAEVSVDETTSTTTCIMGKEWYLKLSRICVVMSGFIRCQICWLIILEHDKTGHAKALDGQGTIKEGRKDVYLLMIISSLREEDG